MRNVPLWVDAAFCVVFLPLIILIVPKEDWMISKYPGFLCTVTGWLYVVYAVNRRWTVPFLFRGRRWVFGSLCILFLSMCITHALNHIEMFAPLYGDAEFFEQRPHSVIKLKLYRQTLTYLFAIVEIFSFTVGILTEMYRQRSLKAAIERERDKAELALYRSQINPHFLFNTLNTLYGLLITKSDNAEQAMEKFIGLTKYIYNNANRNFISIDEEIQFIRNIFDLHKLRLNDMATIGFTYDVQHPGALIPPMLLVTFVENAFKYGISSCEPCFIRIHIEQKDNTISFESENSVFVREGKPTNKMGIENCRKRLALLYPDGRHKLDVGQGADNIFRVRLLIENRT